MSDPTPTRDEAVLSVDALAQEIRRVDGSHSLGAGALAEALMPFILASAPAPASGGVDAVAAGWLYDQEVGNVFRSRWETKWIDRQPGEMRGVRNIRQVFTITSLSPAATPVSEAGGEPAREPWDIESLAQWLHDETEHQESYSGYQWPEHPDDNGNRDGGFVKIVPKHAQAYFRQMAARCFGVRPFSDEYFRALKGEPAALAQPASSPAGGDVRRVRHKKRGGIYEVLGEAQVQTSRPLEDYEVVVIYRSLNTPDIDDPASPMKGDTWVRPKAEFNDGRFEELSQSTSAGRGE